MAHGSSYLADLGRAAPKLSVIFCVNRGNPHLREAIDSVLSQSFDDFELLIGANACTDEFFDELAAVSRLDPRVRLFRTSLGQLSFTLNYLIEHARSEWLVRMDADDVSEPRRFERLHAAAEREDADVIGSWATVVDGQGAVVGQLRPATTTLGIRRRFLWSSQVCHPTVAFRRVFWLRMRGYLGGFVSEDFDLWLRAVLAGVRIVNLPEPLLRYRVHGGQVSRSRLGYAEVASYWYREFLLRPRPYTLCGWLISTAKSLLMPVVHRTCGAFKRT